MRRSKTQQSAAGSRAASCPQKAVDCGSCPRINGGAWMGCPRINGGAFTHKWWRPYIEPVFPCNQYTCSWSFAFWGQVSDLPTNRLASTKKTMKIRIQKSISATLICLLSMYSSASNGQTVQTRGSRSCGTWIEGRQKNDFASLINEAWLVGYLSGVAVATGRNALQGTDNESLFLWMDNYCKSSPLSRIDEGGDTLFIELAKRNNALK